MDIQQKIRLRIDRLLNHPGNSLCLCSILAAREFPIQIFAVRRIQLLHAGIKSPGIHQRQQNQLSAQLVAVQGLCQTSKRQYSVIFAAVHTGCDSKCFSRPGAAKQPGIQTAAAGNRQPHPPSFSGCKRKSAKSHTLSSVSKTTMDSRSLRAYSSFVSPIRSTGRCSVTRP